MSKNLTHLEEMLSDIFHSSDIDDIPQEADKVFAEHNLNNETRFNNEARMCYGLIILDGISKGMLDLKGRMKALQSEYDDLEQRLHQAIQYFYEKWD